MAEASRNTGGLRWLTLVGAQQPGEATGVSPQPPPRRVGRDLSQESEEQSIRERVDSMWLQCWIL